MSAAHVPGAEWQRIWLGIRQRGWSSLAIVPSHRGIDVTRVAEGLAATARLLDKQPVTIVSAVGTQLDHAQAVLDKIAEATARDEWVIVPVDAVTDNPSSIALAQATNVALLVVRLGESLLGASQATLDAVGRDRFIGSIVVDASGGRPAADSFPS